MNIRCKLGFHRKDHDTSQRYLDMGYFGIIKTGSWRCGRCRTHTVWLPWVGFSAVRYGDEDHLDTGRPKAACVTKS